jgi:hypothetical protein
MIVLCVTRLAAGCITEDRFPAREESFLYLPVAYPCPANLISSGYKGARPIGVLEPECKGDCSPSSGFEVYIITSTRLYDFNGMVLGTGIGCIVMSHCRLETGTGNNFDWGWGSGVE